MSRNGFTLVELLVVISIITILATIAFVSFNPLVRFQDSRDSVRWQQANELLNAVKINQLDRGGVYSPVVIVLAPSTTYMIGTDLSHCMDYNNYCATPVSNANACVNMADLVTGGYLGRVPISPNGAGVWTAGHTGYTITRINDVVYIRACEHEHSGEIVLAR